jgi:hypothetical protein
MTEETYTVAVVTVGHFGFGDTGREALDACKDYGGKRALMEQGYVLFRFDRPLHLGVDDFGSLHWTTPDGSPANEVKWECNYIR